MHTGGSQNGRLMNSYVEPHNPPGAQSATLYALATIRYYRPKTIDLIFCLTEVRVYSSILYRIYYVSQEYSFNYYCNVKFESKGHKKMNIVG